MKDTNYYSKRILNNLNLIDFLLKESKNINKNSLKELESLKLKILEIIENYENKYIPQYKFVNINSDFDYQIKDEIVKESSEIKFIYSLIKEDLIHLEILNLFYIINDLINSINGYLREDSSSGFIMNIEHIESLDFERFKKDFDKLSGDSSHIPYNLYLVLLKLKNKIIALKAELKK